MTRPSTSPFVVLGFGYTGHVLCKMGTAQGWIVRATSRNPSTNLTSVASERRVTFDLEQPATWANIPAQADLIWCFPAAPLAKVQTFAKTLHAPPRRLVVLGSTSAYDVAHGSQDYPPPWTDESTPVDLTKPRVQGEEYLRHQHGAIVLRVAGIYGPGRNPLDWIRQGRVGPSRKYVNLIHVEDLAAICLAALEKGKPGEVYNVSDGTPRTWEEICEEATRRWNVSFPPRPSDSRLGKRLSIAKLQEEFAHTVRHPHLYRSLADIEPPMSTHAQQIPNKQP